MFIDQRGRIKIIKKSVDIGTVTGEEIWTPVSRNRIYITDILISCSAATTVTIFFEADELVSRIFKGYFVTNQGAIINFTSYAEGAAGQSIKITNTGSLTSVSIFGTEVPYL